MGEQKNKRSLLAKLISWIDIKLLYLRNKIKYRVITKLSLSWAILPSFVIFSIIIFVAQRDWFGNPVLPKSSAELFFGIGTVTGAMLAIVFAFSSQLVSRASESLPTRYFKLFARDTRLDLYYIALGLITVLEFVLGVISLNRDGDINTFLIRLGVWLIFLTIFLLYFSYVRLIKLLSHEYQVEWLAKYHKKQVDEISYIARRMATASQRGYKNLSAEEKLTIEGSMYEELQNQVRSINNNLDGIIELYFAYKNKGDDYAAHNYIHVASGLIMSYTLSRQHNTLLRFNPEAGLTPESNLSAFLQTSFEKLKIIWDRALKDNDVYAIRKYLRDMQGIVRASLMVDHLKYPSENPAFSTAYYNFSQLVKESIKAKNVDALFEISSVLEQITEIAIGKRHKIDALNAIFDDISTICGAIVTDDDMSAVMYNLIKNLLTICNRILIQDDIDNYRLKKMQEVVPVCIALAVLGQRNSLTDIAVSHFGDNIFAMATYKMGEPPTKRQVDKVIQASKFTISILQKLASIANGARYETQSINRSIMIMTHTLTKMLNNNLTTEQQARDIGWVFNDLAKLPELFPSAEKMESLNDAEDFLDWMVQAAIVSIQENQLDVAKSIFNSVYDYLLKMINAGKTKIKVYEILHMVNKTKLIGATARKLRKKQLQQYIAERIREFEVHYRTKYYPGYPDGYNKKVSYSPSPDMLRQPRDNNVFGYYGSGLPSYFNDAMGLFLESFSQDDLDKFEDYIWK